MDNRLDLVISNVFVGETTLNKIYKDNKKTSRVITLDPKVESVPSYIAFSKVKNLKELRDAFDTELEKMKKNGEYLAIMKKYGISEEALK